MRLTIDTRPPASPPRTRSTYGIQRAHNNGQWAADGGAIVALNPKDGSILAMRVVADVRPVGLQRAAGRGARSLPRAWASAKTALDKNYPSLNRALDGTYPPGSVFKPLTAIAALQEHLIKPYSFYPCTGTYVAPEDTAHHVFHNWDRFVNQGMDLPTAIA